MPIYSGYIYLWFGTKARLYYLGGHHGRVEDRYICSSKMMKRAYARRPETFRFKVLQYVNGDVKDLREAEQRWLDLIKDEELYWTPNIYNKTVRYYNQKKVSSGGNGHANLGNPNIGGHNKGKKGLQTAWNKGKKGLQTNPHAHTWVIIDPYGVEHVVKGLDRFVSTHGVSRTTLWTAYRKQTIHKGWTVRKVPDHSVSKPTG